MSQPSLDPSESIGQLSFRLYYGEVLRQALQEARDGRLDPQWREKVADSRALLGLQSADPHGVRLSVVTAINEMPRAAWEPGYSTGWRVALDSWFDASRAALADHRNIALQQHATFTRLGASMAAAARLAAPSITDAMARISDNDARNDDIARQSLSTFIVQRDTLNASYLAALATAGENVDWRSWFEGRINTWDNGVAADGARMLLRQQHPYIERIPAYW